MITQHTAEEQRLSHLKIKIFEPLPNRNWLESKVNTWLSEHQVDVKQVSLSFSDDKYVITILYCELLEA
jgi:hypothetical protein